MFTPKTHTHTHMFTPKTHTRTHTDGVVLPGPTYMFTLKPPCTNTHTQTVPSQYPHNALMPTPPHPNPAQSKQTPQITTHTHTHTLHKQRHCANQPDCSGCRCQ